MFVVALVLGCFGWERVNEMVFLFFLMELFAIWSGGFLLVFCGFDSSWLSLVRQWVKCFSSNQTPKNIFNIAFNQTMEN